MIQEGKFGIAEAMWLVVFTSAAKVFFTSPATVAALVGTAGWYMTLISALTALLGFAFIYLLLKRFPNCDLAEIFELALGRPLGFVFTGLLAVHLFFAATTNLAEFGEVIRIYVFPLSHNWYIVGLFILNVFILSRLGLETMARLAKLLAYPMLLGYLTVVALGIQNYDINNIFPLFGSGLKKTVLAGIVRCSAYGEVIILAVFAKSFQGLENIKKEGLISLALAALLVSFSLLLFTLTFPYYIAKEITAPMLEMAALIDYGSTLQRVETIFLFIWMISTLISTTVLFYSFVWLYCKMFRITDKKPIVLAGSVVLFATSLMHTDVISVILGEVEFIRKFGSIPFFVLPLVALIVAVIRKKGVNADA
ncbi:MAG: GerAB/ArcD/ProY family transporter [Bacteroidales bacterium]|nr:GerAB/ArcD/ProY family transporter [Bacteroidales bacterium]